MSQEFAGKSVVITGATSGIGRAAMLRFAAEGARVVAFDRSEIVLLTTDGDIEAMQGDAGDERDVERLIARAVERHGGLDIVVANAGILGGLVGLFDQDAGNFAETLRVNLIGPFLAIKHGAQRMLENGGSIICTASVAGLRSGAGGIAYSASKAGVINLVQLAAQQLSGSNIRVNAVCPGLVETGMTQMVFDRARASGKESEIGRLNPLGRSGAPEELAAVIAFLASAEASYVNGHALVADGGLSSSHPVSRPPHFGRASL